MDFYYNYNRCRQFTPPGWGTARTLAPCDRLGRSVAFRAECRPAMSPIIMPQNAGMNVAKDECIQQNPDPCHGRRFCPPTNNQAPINVQLKMCQISDNGGGGNDRSCNAVQQNWQRSRSAGANALKRDPYCEACPNTCPLPRCPPGVKVERTLPIIPARRLQESFFKMPNASVYKTDYVPRQGEITKSYAPERVAVHTEGEFEKQSLTKYDFKPFPVCPYRKPPWAFAKPRQENTMRLNGISMYKTDYGPKDGKPAPSAKPELIYDPDPPPMDDRTVYKIEYIEHPLPDNAGKLTKAQLLAEISNSCCPFDGLTIYKKDYVPKKGKPAESVIDREKRFVKVLDPMDGTTTYKVSYGPFYFDDIECIPAEIYDQMYPPKDKCCDVRCYTEDPRELEDPVQPPQPPCPPPQPGPYCPTPEEMRCSPRVMPCVSPYKLKREGGPYDDCTTIRVEHNTGGECQTQGIEYECPAMPCKPQY